jgi:hypothetical protein
MKDLSFFYHYKDGYDLVAFVLFMLTVAALAIWVGIKEDQ